MDAKRSRVDLDNDRGEVATPRGAAVALLRDVKSALREWEAADSAAAERDSVASKVKGQIA